MPKLFKEEITDDEEELQINSDYANNYNTWRQKEELNKLKTKYGEHVESLKSSDEDSSSSSEEDEEGNELTEEFEREFYKTLACLKNKDPKIYDEKITFFNEKDKPKEGENSEESGRKSKKEKALFLRDYERKIIVERAGKFSDSEEEDDSGKQRKAFRKPTNVEEERKLKESFKKILLDEDDQDDTGLLVPKTKSEKEREKEEEAYKEWLKGQMTEIDEKEQEQLKPLRDFWTDPKLDANEKFLRDYVLNKKFLENETGNFDLDYEQVVHDSDENLSEDENNIKKQEEFEHKYNFRFEEPDQDFIKRYPRTLENSMRKKDTRRAEKRAEVKKRKEEEKLRKREELKHLKALKRKEIEEKIEKLKEITGNDDMKFDIADLDGDFDPAEHDRKMQQLFNEEYYAGPEGDAKPEFPEIDEELGIETTWDKYDPDVEELAPTSEPYYEAPHCEDPDFNMDADYSASTSLKAEMIESSRKKKRRRRSKFAEVIAQKKPKFDPSVYSSYKEYFDQYYALDYEDMIGDLPCRFKYRNVVPNDYGLTIEEILTADDRELNKWCSLKRALQHKPEHAELNDVRVFQQKARNEGLKKKILRSVYAPPEESELQENGLADNQQDREPMKQKRRRRKKKPTASSQSATGSEGEASLKQESIASKEADSRKKKQKSTMNNVEGIAEMEIKQQAVEKILNNESNSVEDETKKTKEKDSGPLLEGEDTRSKAKKRKNKDSANVEDKDGMSRKKKSKRDKHLSSKNLTESAEISLNNKTINLKANESVARDSEKTAENYDQENLVDGKFDKKMKKKKRKQTSSERSQVKGRKQQMKHKDSNDLALLSAERLKAYGINPKKFKNKLKYGQKKTKN